MTDYRITVTDLATGHTETVDTDADSYRDAALGAAETPEDVWTTLTPRLEFQPAGSMTSSEAARAGWGRNHEGTFYREVSPAPVTAALAKIDRAQAAARSHMPGGSLGDFPLPAELTGLRELADAVRAMLAQAMTRDQFDAAYDQAYNELAARGIPRQARKNALLLAAGTGRALAGVALALGRIDTVVTYDRASGYTVRDVTDEDVPGTDTTQSDDPGDGAAARP